MTKGKNRVVNMLRKFDPQLKSVVDAKEDLEVTVTIADIKHSKQKDMNGCAMALACKRELEPDLVVASRAQLYVITKHKAIRYTLSEAVRREITSFDRGAAFTPGDYVIRAPYHKMGTRPGRPVGATTGGKPRRHPQPIANIRAKLSDI